MKLCTKKLQVESVCVRDMSACRPVLQVISLCLLCLVSMSQALAGDPQPMVVSAKVERSAAGVFVKRQPEQPAFKDPEILPTPKTVAGGYLVIHKASPLAKIAGRADLKSLTPKARLGLAQKLDAAESEIRSEHQRLRNALQALQPARALSAATNEIIELKRASNISIIRNLSEKEALSLKRSGFNLQPEPVFSTHLSTSVPLIQADQVWVQVDHLGRAMNGAGVKVGVIDTGIDYTHPSLGGCTTEEFQNGQCSRVRGGYNFIDSNLPPLDDGYHGTHVAGIIGGNGDLQGVAPGVDFYALKVCYGSGGCPGGAILQAIDWATDPNADEDFSDHLDVINLSLGGPGNPDDSFSQAIDTAVGLGIVAVISAGNSGPGAGTIGSPGAARKAITVGASYPANLAGSYWGDTNPVVDQIAWFSSRGPVQWNASQNKIVKPDVIAPGVLICAAKSSASTRSECQPGHIALSGTSMAAPHVTGLAALVRQAHPGWTALEVKHAIKGASISSTNPATGQPYLPAEQGSGRIDALSAVNTVGPVISEISSSGILDGEPAIIEGTASGPAFDHYLLEIKPYGSSSWSELTSNSNPVSQGPLSVIDTYSLPSGEAQLRLTVYADGRQVTAYGYVYVANTIITEPQGFTQVNSAGARTLHSVHDVINIVGTSRKIDFNSFSLEWCTTDQYLIPTDTCSSEGITLSNGGTQQIANGTLGSVDFSGVAGLNEDFYALKLTTNGTGGSDVAYSTIYIDTKLLAGYPRAFEYQDYGGGITLGLLDQPILDDLDGDGDLEIIYAYNNTLDVRDYNYQSLPGWPITLTESRYTQTPPTIDDLDGDSDKELFFQLIKPVYNEQTESYDYSAETWVYHHDGTVAAGWPHTQFAHSLLSTAFTAIDLDQDARADLLAYDMRTRNIDWQQAAGWELGLPGVPSSYGFYWAYSVAATYEPAQTPSGWMARIFGLRMNGTPALFSFFGNGALAWERDLSGNNMLSEASLADLNADGQLDVVFSQVNNPWENPETVVHAYYNDGSVVPGFPVSMPRCMHSVCSSYQTLNAMPPSVADLNLDGTPEIVVLGVPWTDCLESGFCYRVECLKIVSASGEITGSICGNRNNLWGFNYSVELANLDDDSELELIPALSSNSGQCYGPNYANCVYSLPAFNADGTLVQNFPRTILDLPFSWHMPVADINNDGKNELITISNEQIYAWALDSCASPEEEWGQHARDAKFRRAFKPSQRGVCELADPDPTNTPTPEPTATATATPTVTSTATATHTATATATFTQTSTPTTTPSPTSTQTPEPSPTASATQTATSTVTATYTPTLIASPTGTPTRQPTMTITPWPTATPTAGSDTPVTAPVQIDLKRNGRSALRGTVLVNGLAGANKVVNLYSQFLAHPRGRLRRVARTRTDSRGVFVFRRIVASRIYRARALGVWSNPLDVRDRVR